MRRYCILSILLILFIFSCGKVDFGSKNEVNLKYREKNPIEVIKVDSLNGDTEIIGWAKDFIEINTTKILLSGFNQDLNLMDTLFSVDGNELQVKTKIPARVDGKINLKIYVPFILLKAYIYSKNGNMSINKFLGDAEIANKNGNIHVVFQGNILRIDSYKTNVDLYVKSYNSSDIVINNEEGNIKVNIETVSKYSYLDIKSLNGDVSINTSEDIEHKLIAVSKNDQISLKYNLTDLISSQKTYYLLSGQKGVNSNLTIDIFNENGKIILDTVNEKYFKKIINEMPVF